MGSNYYIASPTLNNNFDGKKIIDLSIGEKHAAAIDEAHNIYMWGTDYYGECGYGDYNDKPVLKNIPFSLNIKHLYPLKVKCGYSYTMILDYDNTAIYLGVICDKNIIQDNIDKIERDALHRVPFDKSLNVRCNEIYCGLNMIAIIDTKGNLFLYSDYEGLYYVRIPFEAMNVKFVYDVIYVGINNNDYIYEFSPMRGKQCIEDYIENLYKVDDSVSNIDIIDTPYYDNVLFFSIESEKEMKRRNEEVTILRLVKDNLNSQFGESNEEEMIMNNNGRFNSSCSSISSIYNTKSALNLNINNSNTIIYNRNIARQHTIISGANSFASITNSFNSSNNIDSPSSMNMKKSYKRINRISSLLGRLFDKKIENISKGNIIINNKKQIDVELLVSGWNGKRANGLKGSHQRSMSCVNIDDADSIRKSNSNLRSLSSEKRIIDVSRLIVKDNKNMNSFRKSIKKVLGMNDEETNEKKEEKRNFIDMKKIMAKMKVDKEKKDIIVNNRYQTVSVENNSHTSEEDKKLEEAINISNHKKKDEAIKEELLIGSRREMREELLEGKDYDKNVLNDYVMKDDSYLIEIYEKEIIPMKPLKKKRLIVDSEESIEIKNEIEILEPKSNIVMIETIDNKSQMESKANLPIEESSISINNEINNSSNNKINLKSKNNKNINIKKSEEETVNDNNKEEKEAKVIKEKSNITSMVISHNYIEIQPNKDEQIFPNIQSVDNISQNSIASKEDNTEILSQNNYIKQSFIQEEFHHQYLPVQYHIFHKSSPSPRLHLSQSPLSSLSKIAIKYESFIKKQSQKKQTIKDPIANLLNDINILSPIDSVNPMISINSANTYYINETPLQLTSTPSTESRRPLMLTETKLNSISINPKATPKSLTIEHINLNITTPKKSTENTSMLYAGLISKKQRINRDKLNKFLVSSNTERSSMKISREQTTPIKLISNPVVNNRTINNDIRPKTSVIPTKKYLPFTEKKVEKRKLIHKSNKTLKPTKIKQRNSSISTNNNSLSSTVPIHKRQRSANQLNHPSSSSAIFHHKHNMSTSRLSSLRENYIGYYERALRYSNNKMMTTLLTPAENTTAQKIVDIIDNEETLMSGVSHTSDNIKVKTFNDIHNDIKNYVINNKDKYRNDYNKNDFIPIVTRSDIGDNMIQIEPSCHNSMIAEPLELERSQIK